MKNKNYTKFSESLKKSDNNKYNEKPVETSIAEVQDGPEIAYGEEIEIAEPVKEVKPLTGIVSKCKRLNVRKEPDFNSEVMCILNENDEVHLIDDETHEKFYKICTTFGVRGYCMKKFITINTAIKSVD